MEDLFELIANMIKPSQPERFTLSKTGTVHTTCPICNATFDDSDIFWQLCSNCGADMESIENKQIIA